jgi:fructokinase
MSNIVRLSRADLAWLAPGDDFATIAARWLERGAKIVVLTDGANPAAARTANVAVKAAVPKVAVVDTVGAGDAFMGALLAHLDSKGQLTKSALPQVGEDALHAALEFAARSAAVSAGRAGASPAWLREVP